MLLHMTTTTTHATSTAPHGPNTPSLSDALGEMEVLGAAEGQGHDSQIKAHLRAVELAFLGALNNAKPAQPGAKDHATQLAEAYWKGRNGKAGAQWDPKSRTSAKLRSNFNLDIRLGNWSAAGGTTEPWATTQAFMTEWKRRKASPQAKHLQDATNALHRFAAAQTKGGRKTLIEPVEFDAFLMKKASDPRSAADYVQRIQATAAGLIKGKLPGGAKADDPLIKSIMNSATAWLAENARQRKAANTPKVKAVAAVAAPAQATA